MAGILLARPCLFRLEVQPHSLAQDRLNQPVGGLPV
jgi:hypothetical protein